MRNFPAAALAAFVFLACTQSFLYPSHHSKKPLPLTDADFVAMAHEGEPTPEHPKVGCVAPTMNQNAHVEGHLLPTAVRVIGFTDDEDGRRFKVLLPGVYDNAKWVPMERNQIRFIACGKEAEALNQVFDAEQKGFPQ